MSVLGCYWAPGHQRPTDIDYMQRLQPPAIRVLDPDPNQLVIAHNAAPHALILPRDWALSEQHDDVRRDPVGTGKRHAQEWRAKLDRWQLPIPADQIVVVGINEPQVWTMLQQTVDYNVAFLDECTRLHLRACALNLSVGWPANNGPDTPPDWSPYAPIEAAIKRGKHYLVLHEYWYRTGPRDGWGWFAGRLQHCPWDVPIIIGECGVDMYVDMQRWQNDGKPNRGWRGNIEATSYAYQLEQYARAIDKRVVAILPFLTDYRSNHWESFDTAEAHPALLALAPNMIPQGERHTTHLPIIGNGPTPAEPEAHIPEQPDNTWQRSWPIVLKFEGGLSLDPNDTGNWYNGQLIGTKYGISAAVWAGQYDIPNLTQAQALSIYKTAYWDAANCDALPWPLCLAVFDHAINAGVGSARQLLSQSGPNFLVFMADRIAWYTRLAQFDIYGVAWMRRCAEVLREGAK